MNKSKNEVYILPQYSSACGIDMHKDMISLYVSDKDGLNTFEAQYGTTTRQLRQIVTELKQRNIEVVLMESTGVYWISLYLLLEAAQLNVIVANPSHIKQLPKQKTDKKDARWLCKIAINKLVKPSVVPKGEQFELREFVRMREKYKQQQTCIYNRIVKIIERANIKIRSVSSSIRTKTCQAIIESLMNGQTDSVELSKLAVGSLRKKQKEIQEAVEGKLTSSDIKMLKLLKKDLEQLETQLKNVEQEIEGLIKAHFDLEYNLLLKVTGIGPVSSQSILSELGRDLSMFETADHLTSWSGLAPGNNESAGKMKYSKSRKGNKHLKTILIRVAWAAVRTKDSYWACKMAEYKRRMKPQKAIVAISRRMLKLIYKVMETKMEYKEGGVGLYRSLQDKKANYMAQMSL